MVAYISAFAVPAPLDQAVRRITTPPRMRRMRTYRVLMYLHVPARLWQEPSKREKKLILALQFHREATCSVHQQQRHLRNHLASFCPRM
jgi:hypothetical protein